MPQMMPFMGLLICLVAACAALPEGGLHERQVFGQALRRERRPEKAGRRQGRRQEAALRDAVLLK